jgi:formylglycine-generating enzyme required for sulfatase activity
MHRTLLLAVFLTEFAAAQPKEITNSIGMRLVRIEPGAFTMGFTGDPIQTAIAVRPWRANGDFDERPAHPVKITTGFYIGGFEVTNAQYEKFDPSHKALRGKAGLSKEDNEAVVFVSWDDARRFCEWLSKKEGKPYRLPTEAEWEFSARAGTTTHYFTGDTLPAAYLNNATASVYPPTAPVSTVVGKTPPNAWGLYDVHGNVEEWVFDWYGPYEPGAQTDPVGRATGDFRVTRGGSHSTEAYFLRSENRMGTLPEDKQGLIGFRVALGPMPKTKPLAAPQRPLNQRDVSQAIPRDLRKGPDPDKPYFKGPRKYVKIPPNSYGPMFSTHNHDPGIVECPNGDLLTIYYSCVSENGRELAMLASRLRYGHEEWDDASPFWDAPDRNDHAPALWFNGKDTIYQFNGLSAAATYIATLALVMRTSKDNGATWSKAQLIGPEHEERHMPVQSVFRASDGTIVLPSDVNPGSTVILSHDNGKTWTDPGGRIMGIHAGVVQLKDGRLMALGRGEPINGFMPKSISTDMGKTWTYSASPLQAIRSMQRAVLLRLHEGPLLFISFCGATQPGKEDMMITDASGKQRPVAGLYAALSFDEGETWPARRLISDDRPAHEVETTDQRTFTMSPSSAETFGYLAITQGQNNVIHLISSKNHYAFNLTWLKTPAPALP